MNRGFRFTLLLTAFIAVAAATVFADKAEDMPDIPWERSYDCQRAQGSIAVDGVGDEFAWTLAPTVGEFTRFQKADDQVVSWRTTVKMLWDDQYLYFLIAVDDPDIWSTMTIGDRECLCLEETIEIFIDPDGDTKDYAEIHINCLNTINDIWIPKNDFKNHDGSPVDWKDLYAWEVEGMKHAVMNYGTVNNMTDTDRGSVFEMAMPWNGFGKVAGTAQTPPAPGDEWRINFNRYERPRGDNPAEGFEKGEIELSGWSPLELWSYHVPERFGSVRFIGE